MTAMTVLFLSLLLAPIFCSSLITSPDPIKCDLPSNQAGLGKCSQKNFIVAESAPISVFVDGSWHSQADGTLTFVNSTALTGTSAVLGEYVGTAVHWRAGAKTFVTSVKNYAAAPKLEYGAVVFTYRLPDGGNTTGNKRDLHTDFPAFTTIHNTRFALSWQGQFVQPHVGVATGPQGGPVAFFSESSPTASVFVVSPLSHYLTSAASTRAHDGSSVSWAGGLSAKIRSVPANFEHSFILAAGVGITNTVYSWGQLILGLAPRGFTPKVADQTLEYLSYQTDNGAQYCFCNKDCDNKLLEMRRYLSSLSVPIRFLSFQGGWWTNPNIHTAACAPWCVTSWQPNKTKVPMGLPAFQKALGLPLQLYAPYFCTDTTYDSVNGGNWTFLPGTCGGGFKVPKPEQSLAFYSWLFRWGKSQGGMISFEPDFLNVQAQCVPQFTQQIGQMAKWMAGMADAGLGMEPKMPIQFCMATPYELMQSTQHATVTNFRASTDFFYGSSFAVGTSSLLIWALGARPSKDTFWTTDNKGVQSTCDPGGENVLSNHTCGCPTHGCPPDHNNKTAVLHTLLAVMSTGPVGFSDAIGQVNAPLLMRTCRSDGLLLQPSKPLTTLDRLLPGVQGQASAPTVMTSYTAGGYNGTPGVLGWFILAFGNWKRGDKVFEVNKSDLWPLPSATSPHLSGTLAVHRFGSQCQDGASASLCASLHTPSATAPLLRLTNPSQGSNTAPLADEYYVVAQECKSGWTFLGELSKFAALSRQRFPEGVDCTDSGLTVRVHGVAGEEVVLTALGGGRVKTKTGRLDAAGVAVVSFE